MRAETVTLGVVAAATAVVDLYLWRRLARAEAEKTVLKSALSALKGDENGRISRLEHDLKSPLGVIRGFSTLLKEFVDQHSQDLPGFPLRTVNGIDQAAQKMLQIIEAAAEVESARATREEALVDGENKYR
jgi:signal transduction histidine kinase